MLTMFPFIMLLFLMFIFLFRIRNSKLSQRVYLVDYACFRPKKSQERTRLEEPLKIIKGLGGANFNEESQQLVLKVTNVAGIGDRTFLPEPLLRDPPDNSLEGARSEAEAAIFAVMDAILAKTCVKAEDIGMLVVNSGIFSPVPSLSDMLVNKYKFREDVKTFDISGMGCSASLAAIDLARRLLQVHKNAYVLVVSTEILTPNVYCGNDLNKHTINCVTRVGGAAIMLSNKLSQHPLSKYEFNHAVRTTTASSDHSYKCIFKEEDSQGFTGFNVGRSLVVEARNAIESHLKTMGRLILPKSEQLRFGMNYLMRKLPMAKGTIKEYRPSFNRAIEHFLPHVGAAVVINELERTLKLDVEAPRMTLYRFGNTSSTSVWYELAYIEAKGKVKKGDRVWQMAFGSGFKCNSVVWQAVRSVGRAEMDNPWRDEIDDFPVMTIESRKRLLDPFFEKPK